jgi:hypothetical protein
MGDWLHRSLERYKVPKRIVSQSVARSRWVNEEIKYFKSLGREDRVLGLVVDGEPNASDGKTGFKLEEECLGCEYRRTAAKTCATVGLSTFRFDLVLLPRWRDSCDVRQQPCHLRAPLGIGNGTTPQGFYAWHSCGCPSFASNSKTIAIGGSDDKVNVLDKFSGLVEANFSLSKIRSLYFSPDDSEMLGVGSEQCVAWQLARGGSFVLSGRGGQILQAGFTSDGERIVTTSGDRKARIWDAHDGSQIYVLDAHAARIDCLGITTVDSGRNAGRSHHAAPKSGSVASEGKQPSF